MTVNDKVKIVITNDSKYNFGIDFLYAFKNHPKENCGIPSDVSITCVLYDYDFDLWRFLPKKRTKIITYKQLLERIIIGYEYMRFHHIIGVELDQSFIVDNGSPTGMIEAPQINKWYSNLAYKSLSFPQTPNTTCEMLIEFKNK